MARETLYDFTMNEHQFLLQLAGSEHFDPTITTLLAENGLNGSALGRRMLHFTADRLDARGITESKNNNESRQHGIKRGGVGERRVWLTNHGAAVLLDHLDEQVPLVFNAGHGLYSKFDFK